MKKELSTDKTVTTDNALEIQQHLNAAQLAEKSAKKHLDAVAELEEEALEAEKAKTEEVVATPPLMPRHNPNIDSTQHAAM